MTKALLERVFTVKAFVRAGLMAASPGWIGAAHSQTQIYQTPAHNFYQNNWMAGGGG